MATSNSSKPSAEQPVRLNPRPGRKLRLATDDGERLRPTSPHSPRKPRTSKSPSRGVSVDSISSSPLRSPGRLKSNKSSSIGDEPPPHSLPVTTPKIVPPTNSSKPDRLRVKPSAIRSRSMTRLDASSSMSSPKPPRSPRLGKTVSWSTDSEEDFPRSTRPLPPISSSPKTDGSIGSWNDVSETNDSGTSDNDDDEIDVFTSSFSLPERAPLPDTSSIFQQALINMERRQSSLSSDPGDLHVRRSSLVNSFLNLTDSNSSTTPPSTGIDCLFGMMSTVSENDENADKEQTRLSKSALPKVSNWTGKSRKISAPSKLMTVDQAPLSPPTTPTPSRRRVVSEIKPPRRELLEGADNPRPKTITDSMSESSEVTSSSSQSYITEIPPPLISKRSMNYIMNFISNATVSDAAPGRRARPTRRPTRMKTRFPAIQNSGSSQRARDRRDSLKAIQRIINEGNPLGDTTEITSFDDLRNYRDFGSFSLSPSQPREVLSNYKPSVNHTPISMSRSASSLSPVDEGNEEDTSCSSSFHNPVLVNVIVTSAAPSETFLKLTDSGVFKDETDEEHLDVDELDSNVGVNLLVGDKSQWEIVRDNLSSITQKIGPDISVSDDPTDATPQQDEQQQQEIVLQDYSEVKTKDTSSDATASLISDQKKLTTKPSDSSSSITSEVKFSTTAKSSLTRPKMRSNNLKAVSASKQQMMASPQPRRSIGSKFTANSTLPSVEQAVHRERVNSLLMPASPKKHTLGKISPPSVTAQTSSSTSRKPTTSKDNSPVTRKISPPYAPPGGQPPKSMENFASTHSRADNGTAQRKISPPKLLPPKTTSPRKITPPRILTIPSQLEKLERRKSLPDVFDRSQTSSPKSKTTTAMNRPVGSPKLSPRQVPPRRKISEPCFPSSPPILASPSSLSDRQRGGIFSDPRYNPIIVAPKTTTIGSDLAKKYADKWRGSMENRPLAKLSSSDSDGSVTKTLSNFDIDEYEKLKNCRYIRRVAWNINTDAPST